jgi:hypothetical protein
VSESTATETPTEIATLSPEPTQTPTAAATDEPATQPTSSNTEPPPTPAPPVLAIASLAEQSIRDNKNAVKSGASLDNLRVSFDSDSGLLTVMIRPKKIDRDSQFITNGSALAIITGKAVWTTYTEIQRVSVIVHAETKDAYGNTHEEQMAVSDFSRETGLKFKYSGIANQPSDDNKTMYCLADFHALSERVWKALKDKGCLTSRIGGLNPTEDQAYFAKISQPTVTPTPTPKSVPTPTPLPRLPAPGDVVKVGDLDLTVVSVTRSFNSRRYNQFNSANVAVRVRATNARGDSGDFYNLSAWGFKLIASNGIAYSTEIGCAGCPEEIVSVDLIRGGMVDGYLYFAVPENVILTDLYYQPLFSFNETTIDLR